MEADFRLARRPAACGASNCYSDFFKTFCEANFLPFNYDSLPEISLVRLGRWYPHDGYGLPVQAEPSRLKPSESADPKSTSLVLHLHGSFCVYTSTFETEGDPGDAIDPLGRAPYIFDPDSISLCFPQYGRVLSDSGYERIERRVVAPVPDKAHDLKQAFVRATYAKALPLVRASGTLVAVGYSFNSYDRASYDPVLQALDESRERTLTVVSPQAGELVDKIGAEYHTLQVKPINKTFKSWAADSFRC
jgi:hypothetical protein